MSTVTVEPVQHLEESDWRFLLRRIELGKCTPILGPDFAPEQIPSVSEIARALANDYSEYPFLDCRDNLQMVAQYIAFRTDSETPQDDLQRALRAAKRPDFNLPRQPHRILAGLPIPVYVTTSYDNFMYDALKSVDRDARIDWCRWYDQAGVDHSEHSPGDDPEYVPTPANPLVFHMFGHVDEARSLVITEDHHLEYLANVCSDINRVWKRIQHFFGSQSTMMFLGFQPNEFGFRVLLRTIIQVGSLRKQGGLKHVAVQVFTIDERFNEAQREETRQYLEGQLRKLHQLRLEVTIYWGACADFLGELKRRWEESRGH